MQKTKRPLSFLLAVLMIVGMFAAAPFTASAETIYNTADEDIEARDLRVGDILASPGAWKEYTIRGNHEYQLVLEGGGYFYDGILQTEDYVFSEDESQFRFRGDFFDDVPDDVPVVNDFYAPADKDGIVTDKWYVIGTGNNKITISGKGFVITPCDMETLDFTKHSGGFVGNCCIVSPGSGTEINEKENAWEWWFDGDYSLQEMGVTISSLLESDIRKVVVYTESHWNNFWNGTPIAVVGDTTLTYTRDGNAFTFDNVDAASVVISATGGSGIKITKIDVYYVDTDPDVENVIALIDAIGTVEYTPESKAKIDEARTAYDALTDEQKALVSNADALTDAETAYQAAAAESVRDWQSVTIADEIYINFIPAVRDGLESVKIEYMDQGKVSQAIIYDLNELAKYDETHYLIPVVVAPAQIGDTVKATLTVNGNTITRSSSISEYCKALIAGNYTANQKALAAATLEYGQAANNYFAGTGFYAPNTFADTEKAKADVDAVAGRTNTMALDVDGKIVSASFMALTRPEFRFHTANLTETDAIALNGKITVDGPKGVAAQFVKSASTGAILLEVTGIEAATMDRAITITIDGFGTLTFRGNDFARLMAKNAATAVLGAALYNYGAAAQACFAA